MHFLAGSSCRLPTPIDAPCRACEAETLARPDSSSSPNPHIRCCATRAPISLAPNYRTEATNHVTYCMSMRDDTLVRAFAILDAEHTVPTASLSTKIRNRHSSPVFGISPQEVAREENGTASNPIYSEVMVQLSRRIESGNPSRSFSPPFNACSTPPRI